MGQHDVVNYWDYLPRYPKTVIKCLEWSTGKVCKIVSWRPTGLFCTFSWYDSASRPLVATTTWPLRCFSNVCLATLNAAVLKRFPTGTNSAHCGAATSNKRAPTNSAAVTTYLLRNGCAVLQKLLQVHRIPFLSILSTSSCEGWRIQLPSGNQL